MKRTQFIISAALLSGLVLSGCNKSSSESKKDYNIVSFMYNNDEATNEVYKNVVVMNGQTIDVPKDPVIKDYVFAGWYTEPQCQNEYKRWGLEIDSDLQLYARWTPYIDATLEDKIGGFQKTLKEMSNNVYKTTQTCDAVVMYPSLYEGQLFVSDRYVYNRYSDITIKDYYQILEDGEDYYGQEQFSYDNRYFYSIYHEFDNLNNNESKQVPFEEESVEAFLDIGFYNLFKSCENNILYYNKKPQTDTFQFLYEFGGNYTELALITNGVYSYEERYVTAQYSDGIGTYVTTQYSYKYGIEIKNGKITSASVDTEFIYALGEDDIQQYVSEISTYDFYYGNGTYENFTGVRF